MKKTFCRAMGLLLTLCLLVGMLSYLTRVTRLNDEICCYEDYVQSLRGYDVFFLGNSHMLNGVYPMELWAESGIRAYNLSYSDARMGSLYWILRCALEKGTPSVVVLDSYLLESPETVVLPYFQCAFSFFPLSVNKLRAAFALCPPGEKGLDETFSLIWSFSQFHSRWPELRGADFAPGQELCSRGAIPLVRVAKPDAGVRTEEALPLDTCPNSACLRRIAELCRKRNIRLVLTTLPFSPTREEAMAANGAAALAKELGVEYVNLLDMESLDPEADYYDSIGHLNVSGALKTTRELGRYLREECGLPDRRGDTACAEWDTDYLRWRQELAAMLENQPVLQPAWMLLGDPGYTSVIRIAPGSPLFEDAQTGPLLRNLCGGAALPGLAEAAAAGQSYLLLSDRSRGLVAESVGSDTMVTPLGTLRAEPENARLTLGEESFALAVAGDQSKSDAMCFVFSPDLEPLTACSHAFARTAEGIYERCDY